MPFSIRPSDFWHFPNMPICQPPTTVSAETGFAP